MVYSVRNNHGVLPWASKSWAPPHPQLQAVQTKPKLILIVAMDPVRPLELFALSEVFQEANRIHGGDQLYDVRLVAAGPTRNLNLSRYTGNSLHTDMSYQEFHGSADTVLISGSDEVNACIHEEQFLGWLRLQSRRSRRMGSAHTGTLVLAKAGLLNGRKATTHWKYCDELQNKFPTVCVERNVIFVRHENFYTSAGAVAAIDLALALVEDDLGPAIASKVAQTLIVFSRRSGSQPQVSATLTAQSKEKRPLGDLLPWLPDNLQQDLSVKKLARRAAMSPRNFARLFRAQLGTTPAKHIEHLRVETARAQLEATTNSLEGVAAICGFTCSETLRRVFRRHMGVTPGQYRASVKLDTKHGKSIKGNEDDRKDQIDYLKVEPSQLTA